ncbi:MATE family efflux transporter [Chloroflexota bacterium]
MAEDLQRRTSRFDKDWTQGSIVHNLWSLAWPMMISNSINMLGPTIDMIWVGKLGAASIAGVGISGMIVMMMNSARMGLDMGMRAMIARAIGAGNHEEANHIIQQAIFISGSFSTFMAIIGISLAEPILVLMGVEPDVVSEGAAYMRILFVSSIFMSFRTMAEGAMQASGDTITPMKMVTTFRLFHVALCPFLVFGWWIFPRLGVSGAAVANVFAQSLGMILGMWFLFSGRTRLKPTINNYCLDFSTIMRIVKIAVPASISGMQRSLANLMVMGFIVPFGTFAVAAHTLCQRIEMMIFMPLMAMGMSAGVLAGQNLGAGKPERAEKSGWGALGMVECFLIVIALGVGLWTENIIHVFTIDPGVVEVTSSFLMIAIIGYLILGFNGVLGQFISGVGDTLPPMVFGMIMVWCVQVPLSYYLPKFTDLGVVGVRWAIVIAIAVGAICNLTYFRMGRWKLKRV